LTGQPAISVPCGFSKSNLPIGLQVVELMDYKIFIYLFSFVKIVGDLYQDGLVMQIAHAYQQKVPTVLPQCAYSGKL